MRYTAINSNSISKLISKVSNLTCFEFRFTFFKIYFRCEFVYFEIFVCLILLCEIANIGANVTVCVGASVPKGKGSMGACTQRKNCQNTIRSIHCDQLILRKISKIGATRCQILRLKCTKFDFDFRWGSSPDPAGGAYSPPPEPLAVFKGPTSKGREGEKGRGTEGERKGKEGRGEKGGDEKENEGKGGKRGEWGHAPIEIFESWRLWHKYTEWQHVHVTLYFTQIDST